MDKIYNINHEKKNRKVNKVRAVSYETARCSDVHHRVARNGHQQYHGHRGYGVRCQSVAGVGLQQRVLKLLTDFLGVHAHVVSAVGVPGATLRPHVQRVRVGLVPFVRGRVDFQFHCANNGQ